MLIGIIGASEDIQGSWLGECELPEGGMQEGFEGVECGSREEESGRV
jgi:hypothetical protein